MDSQKSVYAVLTGDLVESSKLSSQMSSEAMAWLREAADTFSVQHVGSVVGKMDTFRHDSWQLLLERPELSFRAAAFLRVSLKQRSDGKMKFDTRVSIGVGEVELIEENRVSDSRGAAFTVSGKKLDAMDHSRLAYSMAGQAGPQVLDLTQTLVPLLDCVITDWTSTESRAVCGALRGWTQERTAECAPPNPKTGEPVTRQAVSLSLERAHWGTVMRTLDWLEEQERKL